MPERQINLEEGFEFPMFRCGLHLLSCIKFLYIFCLWLSSCVGLLALTAKESFELSL